MVVETGQGGGIADVAVAWAVFSRGFGLLPFPWASPSPYGLHACLLVGLLVSVRINK